MSTRSLISSTSSLGSIGSVSGSFDSRDYDNTVTMSVSVTAKKNDDTLSEISKDDSVDMNLPMGLRNRTYNKDVKFHKKVGEGTIPIFTQTQINEMRRVIKKKNMQLLKHYELQPMWVRMGMKGKYPKNERVIVNVAKMKQFAVLNLDIVAHTNEYANSWVSAS
jgi:acyl-CoA thioesterase